MRNWLRRLHAAWIFSRYFPYVEIPEKYWTREDAMTFSHFMVSDTGVKLRHMWRMAVHNSAQKAISERQDSAYVCGVAFGIRSLLAETDSLLTISPDLSELDQTTTEKESQFQSVNK
jgi:hypothetical protein